MHATIYASRSKLPNELELSAGCKQIVLVEKIVSRPPSTAPQTDTPAERERAAPSNPSPPVISFMVIRICATETGLVTTRTVVQANELEWLLSFFMDRMTAHCYIYIILCLISVSATPSGWVMPILWESSIGIICVSANIKLTDTMYACFVTAATYTYVWHALYVLISLYNYNYCVYSTSFRRFRGRVLSIYIRALICIHRQVSWALINT